jgi:hypothetical protein
MLYLGEEFRKHHFRKESSEKRNAGFTYKEWRLASYMI